MLIFATSSDRDKKRERERRARQRRAAKLEQMRLIHDKLECAVLVSHTFDDVDALWEDVLDDRVMRVRRFVRHSLRLAKEIQELHHERTLLLRLLEEHRLALEVIADVTKEHPVDDWEFNVAWWREVSRTRFKPWTLDDCKAEMETALKEVNAFDWSLEKETTGLSFLDWREQRRVDRARDAFQFEFYKTYRGYEMMDFVNVGWDMYTEPKTFKEILMGPGVLCFHEVLQQLGPNVVIIWVAQRPPHMSTDTHMTFLVCRVKTDRGILQCVRSIECPELIAEVARPLDVWASTFLWKQWAPLDHQQLGYTYRLGGSIVGKDMTYLHHWMLAIFGVVLRSERLATGWRLVLSEDADM